MFFGLFYYIAVFSFCKSRNKKLQNGTKTEGSQRGVPLNLTKGLRDSCEPCGRLQESHPFPAKHRGMPPVDSQHGRWKPQRRDARLPWAAGRQNASQLRRGCIRAAPRPTVRTSREARLAAVNPRKRGFPIETLSAGLSACCSKPHQGAPARFQCTPFCSRPGFQCSSLSPFPDGPLCSRGR